MYSVWFYLTHQCLDERFNDLEEAILAGRNCGIDLDFFVQTENFSIAATVHLDLPEHLQVFYAYR